MADQKLTELTAKDANSLVDTDLLYAVDVGADLSVKLAWGGPTGIKNVLQPRTPQLDALGAFNQNGLLTQTSLSTYVARSITAAGPRITVTNGDGGAGDPAIDLGAVPIGDLSDVTIAGIASGDILQWSGAAWQNITLTAAGIAKIAEVVLRDGSQPLTGNWNAGPFGITANQFQSEIGTGTPPLTVQSTTLVANLNADTVDGIQGAEFIQRNGSVAFAANQSMNNNRLTSVGDPLADQDAANKRWVEALIAGLQTTVRVATTTAGNLASDFENGDTIDGIVLATGDRILIKNQTNAIENGVYDVQASGAPVRSSVLPVGNNAAGFSALVLQGTANADSFWICISDPGSDLVGTDPLNWQQLGGGGGGGESNTASNVNVGGVGVFKQKSGVNLEFRGIDALNAQISVTLDAGTNRIQVGLGSVQLTDLSDVTAKTGAGTIVAMADSPKFSTPQIHDLTATHTYNFTVAELTASRNVALPLLGANDTFVFNDHAATLQNKTIEAANNTLVLGLTDLSDVAAKSGTGSIVLMQASPTITTPFIGSFVNAAHDHKDALGGGLITHADTQGLTADDHTQYALLAGRAGGQLLRGGTNPNDNLTLDSTSGAPKGNIVSSCCHLFQQTAAYDNTYDNGTITGPDVLAIDWKNGNKQKVTITGASAVPISFSAPNGTASLQLKIIQGATPTTVVWPANVKWVDPGTAPTLATVTGKYNWATFVYDPPNYDAQATGDFTP